jgi:hypothetical protein
MRTVHLAVLALAVGLAGCGGTTFPWTTDGSGSASGGGGGGGGGATLQLSASSLSFSAVQGGSAPSPQGVGLSVSGTGPTNLYVTVANGGPPVSSASFQIIAGVPQVVVSVVAPSTVGTTTGTVTVHVYADSARTQELGGSPRTINVTYSVNPAPAPGTYDVSPSTLSFGAIQGDTSAPASQDVTVTVQGNPVYFRATPSGIAGLTATVTSSTAAGAVIRVAAPTPGAPGTTGGSVTIRGYSDAALTKEVPGSPKTVTVSYAVTASQFAAAPASLDFSTPAGVTPAAKTVGLSDPVASASWLSTVTYQSGSGWLSVAPASGSSLSTLPATASVSVTPPTTPGTYGATIKFSARGVTANVVVTLTVTKPKVFVAPAQLAFSGVSGQTTPPAAQTLSLTTENGGNIGFTTAIAYDATATGWLSVAASGTAPASLALGVQGPTPAVGRHTATLTVTPSNGAAPVGVPVTYDVMAPELTVTPGAASFTVDATTTSGATSAALSVGDAGTLLAWTATPSVPWLQVTPASGTTPSAPTLSLVLAGIDALPPGSHSAEVILGYVAASGATVQVRVPVTLLMDLPLIDVVAPRVSVQGIGGMVVVRGDGFATPYTGGLLFGATATAPTGVSATEVHVTPPALAPGTYPVTPQNALGLARSNAHLDVVASATRSAASATSAGKKAKLIFDDVQKALYVVNTASGKLQRHREAAGWALAADGSDEVSVSGLVDAALSPDGATLLAVDGTSLKTIDLAIFKLAATQPSVSLMPYGPPHVEFGNDGRAFLGDDTWGVCRFYDPASDALTATQNCTQALSGLVGSKDGSRVVILGSGYVDYDDASSGTMVVTGLYLNATTGGVDRHATRTLLFGWDGNVARYESKLYDASWTRLPGSVPSDTLAAALSGIGLDRAYTWDGSQVHAFSLSGSLDKSGVYYATESFKAVTPTASPGANPKLALSADEKTAFLAGDSALVVVPLP